MKIFHTRAEISSYLRSVRQPGLSVGFVPTMGALHAGHFSLLTRAREENDLTAVSVFVNPTQFNDPKDLERYPRDLDADIKLLMDNPPDVLFAPSEKDIYPEKDTRTFNLSPLDSVMEGKFRPGHFNGVAQVVSKLFDIVRPDRAYFGLKDFQQYVIIRRLTEQLEMDTEIIGCPIIREEDGLAMSSRNRLLTPGQRKVAPLIYRTLTRAKAMQSSASPAQVRDFVISTLNSHPELKVEYFEVIDDQSLNRIKSWDNPVNKVGCIAVHLGGIRLIDNIYFD